MVGVAGKFKGCNTCRTRRVKCDNTRPHCKKCLDGGRECDGYDRDLVFIVGTARDLGRCSSHPHRNTLIRRGPKSKKAAKSMQRRNLVVGGVGKAGNQAGDVNLRCLAVQTMLELLEVGYGSQGDSFTVSTASLMPGNSRSSSILGLVSRESDFEMRAVCLLDDMNEGPETMDFNSNAHRNAALPTCLFPYEIGPQSSPRSSLSVKVEPGLSPPGPLSLPFRNVLGGNLSQVQQHGASHYATFPEHYFFTRLLRIHLTFHALTHRQPTFIAEEEWTSIPWKNNSKGHLDNLFDILVLIPEIFARGEELEVHHPSIARRLHAKDLLEQCTSIDQRLQSWLSGLKINSETSVWWKVTIQQEPIDSYQVQQSPPWLSDTKVDFQSSEIAELMLYYWAGLCTFYRAVQHIHVICTADIPTPSSPAVETKELQSYDTMTTTDTPLSTQCFTPPQQRQEHELVFGADWNHQAFMPTSAAAQLSPLYTADLPFSNYIPDAFISPTGFTPDIPVDFDYAATSQAFLPSSDDYAAFVPPTENFAMPARSQTFGPDTFYSYEPTFLIPATPTSSTTPNVCLPAATSFPLLSHLPQSQSYPTHALSPDPISYRLSTHTPLSSSRQRHNSTPMRANSFSHTPLSGGYIHSRSPTPTALSLSSAASSNPSLRNSVSNATSNPNSNSNSVGGNGYPGMGQGTSPPNSYHGANTERMTETLILDGKYGEGNVLALARNIVKGIPYLLSGSGAATSSGGPVIAIAMREAIKVLRRQGKSVDVEVCKRLLEQSLSTETGIGKELGWRVWREWGGNGSGVTSALV